jgi:predicted glycosyltransferase
LSYPFTTTICTPSCYTRDLGEKQVRYNGYHELAYLHPNRFTPNPAVLTELDLAEGDPFIIVRFVSWQASHDVGQHGIRDKVGLVKALEQYGRVLITSEGALPEELQSYQIRVSPEKLHDLLYYATLYVGEGGTTASEAAVLGTHAIYVNTLPLGYIAEEDEKYHLVSDFSRRDCTDETVLAEARRLLQNPNLRREGKEKGEALVQDKIDVTAFMVWFVENYPESASLMRNCPDIQQQFGYH